MIQFIFYRFLWLFCGEQLAVEKNETYDPVWEKTGLDKGNSREVEQFWDVLCVNPIGFTDGMDMGAGWGKGKSWTIPKFLVWGAE